MQLISVVKDPGPGCSELGPCLMTAGLLGEVKLVATSVARIDYVYCDQLFDAGRTACTVTVNAEVYSPNGGETAFSAKLGDVATRRTVTLAPGTNKLSAIVNRHL